VMVVMVQVRQGGAQPASPAMGVAVHRTGPACQELGPYRSG